MGICPDTFYLSLLPVFFLLLFRTHFLLDSLSILPDPFSELTELYISPPASLVTAIPASSCSQELLVLSLMA